MTYEKKNPEELTADDLTYIQHRQNMVLKRIKYLSKNFGEKGGPHTFSCPCCHPRWNGDPGVKNTGTVTYSISPEGGVEVVCSTPNCCSFVISHRARHFNGKPFTPIGQIGEPE